MSIPGQFVPAWREIFCTTVCSIFSGVVICVPNKAKLTLMNGFLPQSSPDCYISIQSPNVQPHKNGIRIGHFFIMSYRQRKDERNHRMVNALMSAPRRMKSSTSTQTSLTMSIIHTRWVSLSEISNDPQITIPTVIISLGGTVTDIAMSYFLWIPGKMIILLIRLR